MALAIEATSLKPAIITHTTASLYIMQHSGILRKMQTKLADPVQYSLPLDDKAIALNAAVGQTLTLTHTGIIHCIHCGRKSKKSFNQGYCYPCFRRLAQCDRCIIKPELCHFDQGSCREPEWGKAHCLQDHYVYLANSSGLKVGITRHTQIPTRWIDQGAIAALAIIKVQSRLLSGLVEVIFKQYVADKTYWQRMLKGQIEAVDLKQKRDELFKQVQADITALQQQHGQQAIQYLNDENVVEIDYPVLNYPSKVKSANFDKTAKVTGILQGIKGQYLIFDHAVINIRKFGGYEVEVDCEALCC